MLQVQSSASCGLRGATLSLPSRIKLFDLPGSYRIRVRGWLDPSWSGRMSGLTISASQATEPEPVTTLTGDVTDQAALMGVLNALYDMGFPLLGVERLGASPPMSSHAGGENL